MPLRRFLQLWLKLVQKVKPWDVPTPALYKQLHDLIDSGLHCDAAAEEEEEAAHMSGPAEEDDLVLPTRVRAAPDGDINPRACKRANRTSLVSQREH